MKYRNLLFLCLENSLKRVNKKGQFDLFYDHNTVIEVRVQFKQKLQSNQLL